ncbi:MAG: hypothetical protein HQL52_14605 [Magnetococcales bacterium]|nr:hypothetical protein [Magnetococcales bacterium]
MPFDILPIVKLLKQPWLWVLIVGATVFWAVVRFIYVPAKKRKRIKDREKYCSPLLLPTLPEEFDKSFHIPSRLRRHKTYEVNLYQVTCTCYRFRRSRQYYPRNDIHRLCHHLRRELDRSKADLHFCELDRRILKDRVRDRCYRKITVLGTELAFGLKPHNDFVRVFTRVSSPEDPLSGPFTGPYDKFTFNAQQETWVYGEGPPGNEVIIDRLLKELAQFKKDYNEAKGIAL